MNIIELFLAIKGKAIKSKRNTSKNSTSIKKEACQQHTKTQKTVDEDFSTATWVVEDALDKVFDGISIAKEIEVEFRKEYCIAHKSGDPRMEEKVAIELLENSGWRWHAFEKWYHFFLKEMNGHICGLEIN